MVWHVHADDVFMKTGDITSQPIGHYEFCQRYPGECTVNTGKIQPIRLTQSVWKMILTINHNINTRICPATDLELYGKEEYWT